MDRVTGQEDTKPWSRFSLLGESLPESLYTAHPSIEGYLSCDLYQGFGLLVYSVTVRPRREMGDTKAFCLTRENVECQYIFCFIPLLMSVIRKCIFTEKKSEKAWEGTIALKSMFTGVLFMPSA